MREEDLRKGTGEEELQYLLRWIVKNPEDWNHICDPDFFQLGIAEILELVEKLERAGLQPVAYLVLNHGDYKSKVMGAVRRQIVSETMADISGEKLMERIKEKLREQIA